MNILRSVSQSVLGSQQDASQPTGAETVERLLDRVQSSTLLEDRRDACRAIKSLSRKYRVLVGAHGMDTLIQVLESDRNDHEIVNFALESLRHVTSNEVYNEAGEENNESKDDKIGEQFTEIFIKRVENISLVLSMLDEFDFRVCFPAMRLLSNLLINRPRDMQEAILVIPNGISKLMDKLSDNREVIRNDTLVILTQLSKGNTNTQKIIVFENVYDRLFEIISQEDYADGGIVVEDCLILMLNLLKNNISNQTLFKEGNYMQEMTNFFSKLAECEADWSTQKVTNVRYMLKVVRTLVSPKNSAQVVNVCQRKMHNCQLLQKLCTLLMAVGVPADILIDTISTVSDIIRGSNDNQEFFATVTAPSNPPRPVIVVLLMSMVNDKQPFMLRSAILYCFQSFLFRNVTSQSKIVQTLLPQTTDNASNQITVGQLLCGGLFSMDPLSNWFSAIALSHVLHDNVPLKEQLLRVQLARGVGSPSVSLLQQCILLLQGGGHLLTRLGLLQLLCVWIAHCPIAVSHFLNISSVVSYLTAFLSANEHDECEVICQGICAFLLGLCGHFNDGSVPAFSCEALKNLISNRVGVENFIDKLENILRTEANSKAAKSPQLNAQQPSDIVFDHEFTRMFKSLESAALKAVTPKGTGADDATTLELVKCKQFISDQEIHIKTLQQTIETLNKQLLNTQNSQQIVGINADHDAFNSISVEWNQKVADLQKQLDEMTYARDYYYYAMVEKENQLKTESQVNTNSDMSHQEMDNLRKQLEDMQLILHQRDEKINCLTNISQKILNNDLEKPFIEEIKPLKKMDEKKEANLYVKLQEDHIALQAEQEDILILLSEQESKLIKYKEKLLGYGHPFSDDDSSDSDNLT